MAKPVYTVKEFNELVNTVLNQTIGETTISGEISGYKLSQGKWITFDLKDKDSVLNCFMPAYQLDMPIADGQQVLVTGVPRVYVPYGKYSLTVKSVQLTGEGALQKAYEELKAKLEVEGLFSPTHKKALPRFPETIGIITSGDGAAINDIRKVIDGRWGGLKLFLAPVLVQGKDAPDDLVGAISYFNQHHPVDVIIFGRGGGSLEDLQAFNSERVARAIFASRIPIIAGIGHEHNTSIADLVADVRAATPSNAAEIVVPHRAEILTKVTSLRHHAENRVQQHINQMNHTIGNHRQTLQFFIQGKFQTIRLLIQRIQTQADQRLAVIGESHRTVLLLCQKLTITFENKLNLKKQQLTERTKLMSVLNPESVLQRGYSITYNADGKPITRLDQVPSSGTIKTHLQDGSFTSTIGGEKQQASLF
jgi:exodeoxyribonuclease VII large subunit